MLILEDGSEVIIKRRGRANIREQMKVMAFAAQRGTDAVVLECMALHPELQWISEHRIVRSTIGVITNIRDDHREVFPSGVDDMARSLSHTIPEGGLLVTGATKYLDLFRAEATAKGSTAILAVSEGEISPSKELDISWFEENCAIALAVCERLGVERERALAGMVTAGKDLGALSVQRISSANKRYTFVNAFSVNDPDTLVAVKEKLSSMGLLSPPVIALVNCRADRPLRSVAFGAAMARLLRPDRLVLIGEGVGIARRAAIRHGYDDNRIVTLGKGELELVLAQLSLLVQEGATVIGTGNFHSLGARIINWLKEGRQDAG